VESVDGAVSLGRAMDSAGARGRGRIGVWLQTLRVKSLAISSIAVFAGAAVALYDGFASWRIVIAWLGAVAIQAGTNLINVSWNYKSGDPARFAADPRGSSAPVRSGLLTPDRVRRGAFVAFGIGIACGLVLVALCGWPILAIGVPAVFAGWSYGAPPFRLAYRGFGVVTVLIFMGPIMVIGSYFVVAMHASAGAAFASVAIGMLAAAIMHTNDLRDYESDVAHRKRTLATMTGRERASDLLAAMLVLAWVAIVLGAIVQALPWPTLAVLVTTPSAIRLAREVRRERGAEQLNAAWFHGVKLHSQFGIVLIAALLLSSLLS
jgi:1,4-dihydroxy-2-naphthoate polyprenyltransferase